MTNESAAGTETASSHSSSQHSSSLQNKIARSSANASVSGGAAGGAGGTLYTSSGTPMSSSNSMDQLSSFRTHYSYKSSFYEENAQNGSMHQNHRVVLKKKHNSSLLPVSSFLSSGLLKHISKHYSNGKAIQKEFAIENMKASLLFIDLSGFTALFQKTSTQVDGAERMTRHVNAYFSLLLNTIFKHGGDVEKWAGDAMLVLFYENDLRQATFRALQCGMEIQQTNHLREYVVDDVKLTLHCGVASGTFNSLHVGGVNNEWKRILLGSPLADLEQAVSESKQGEVMISSATHALIQQDVSVTPIVNSDAVLLKKIIPTVPLKPDKPIVLSNQMEAAMRSFLDPFTVEKIDAQQADSSLLSSIKKCTLVFITLSPMNTEKVVHDANAKLRMFHENFHRVQTVVYDYEGSIVNFLADEKGILIAICFGHPVAHTNDAYRAIAAALKIEVILQKNASFHWGIGIATGQTFVGTVGGIDRRDFTTISAASNTSARLMKLSQVKEESRILCDMQTMQEASSRIDFDALEPVQMKGFDTPISVYKVEKEKESTMHIFNQERAEELSTVRQDTLEQLFSIIKEQVPLFEESIKGRETDNIWMPPVVLIKKHGPSVGCTRLIRVLLNSEDSLQVPVVYHVAEDTNHTPFELFGEWARGAMLLFALKENPSLMELVLTQGDGDNQNMRSLPTNAQDDPSQQLTLSQMRQLLLQIPVDQKKAHLLQLFDSFGSQKEFLSLLNSVLEVDFAPSPRLSDLSPEEQRQTAIRLLEHLLVFRFSHGFSGKFSVAAFDDFHYADQDSVESFFHGLIGNRNIISQTIMKLVCVDTTLASTSVMKRLEEAATVIIDLETLQPSEMEAFIREVAEMHELEALHADTSIVEFVNKKAGADISRAELIVAKLIENDLIFLEDETRTLKLSPGHERTLESLKVPNTLSLMVQQRIDRLDANARLVLKIAAVIGVLFSFETLQSIFPSDVSAFENLHDHLHTIIESGNLVIPTEHKTYDGKAQYSFVSRNVRNIAYSGLLQSLKVQIHGELALYYTEIYNLDRATKQFTVIENKSSALWNELHTTAEHFSTSLCTMENTPYTEDAIALIRIVVEELEVKHLFSKAIELQKQLLLIIEHRQDYDETKTYLKIQTLTKLVSMVFKGQLWISEEYTKLSVECLTEGLALSNTNNDLHWDLCMYKWWASFRESRHDEALALYDDFKASIKNDTEEFYFHTSYTFTSYSMARFDDVERHTKEATRLYARHQDGIFGTKTMSFFQHDLIVNVIIFSSRSSFFTGKLKSSKRLMFEADNVQERRKHLYTTRFSLLFNLYAMLLRHDFDLMLHSIDKLKVIEDQISDNTSMFYINLCEFYRIYVLFMTSSDETDYETMYSKIKKMATSGSLDNHIVLVGLFEAALKYLSWLHQENSCVQLLTEIFSLDELMTKKIITSSQEHLKSELYRLYADMLVLKRSILLSKEKVQLIYKQEEQIIKYDLKTRKPIIATKEPIGVQLKEGVPVYWCSCGLSKNQPFCDGSHAVHNTGLKPMRFLPDKDMDVYFCGCKQTLNPPFCDGTHRQLTEEDEVGKERISGVADDTADANSCRAILNEVRKEGSDTSFRRVPELADISSWYERALSLCATQNNITIALKVYVSLWKLYDSVNDEHSKGAALHNLTTCLAQFIDIELDIDIPFVAEALDLVEEQKKFNREFVLLVKHGNKKVKVQLKSLNSVQKLKDIVAEKLSLSQDEIFELTFLDEDFGEDVDLVDDVSILPSKAVVTVHLGTEKKGE